MTWNAGHVWMMNAFLPPGTYPFKVVVFTPSGKPESARWENGPNRSLAIDVSSPELGTAALVLVDCQFDSTAHTNTQTKRVTGIGFKATNPKGNPHLSTNMNGNGAGPSLPSAQAMAASSSADSSYRASMMAAAGIPTSKVTANAVSAVPQQQQQQQVVHQQVQQVTYQQAPQQQQEQQYEPAMAAAVTAGVGAANMPGTEAFNHRIADLDSRLAALLSKNGKQPLAVPHSYSSGHAGSPSSSRSGSPRSPPGANNIVGAPAAAVAVQPQPAALQPAAPAQPPAQPPASAATAATAAAIAAAGPMPGGGLSYQPPPEVQAAAAVCKEDPGAADACRVVTKFISGEACRYIGCLIQNFVIDLGGAAHSLTALQSQAGGAAGVESPRPCMEQGTVFCRSWQYSECLSAAACCLFIFSAPTAPSLVVCVPADHLEMIESQALEMMKHNERLEKRMAALEQHTQVRTDRGVAQDGGLELGGVCASCCFVWRLG
jgi:hypothetical protein